MKLLLVEDDPEICGMLKKFLEKENFEIITANDGEEACSKFRQETCDLVLLDLMLPKSAAWMCCSKSVPKVRCRLSLCLQKIRIPISRLGWAWALTIM